MQNSEFAKLFYEISELLELKNENPFKIRAYQKAARNVEDLSKNLTEIYKSDGLKGLEEIPGIGKNIAEHIEEIIKTGKLKKYESLKKEFPRGLIELTNIPGMGPKTAIKLRKELGIDSVKKLEAAAKAGKINNAANILRGIDLKKRSRGRYLIDDAASHAELIVNELKKIKGIKKILPCGSLRRGQETVGDLDILVVSENPGPVMDAFTRLPYVKNILAKGKTKSSVILKNGMQADLRVVPEKSFGAAAHYFTGCRAHNIHIRQLAQKKGWKVSEYGIFKGKKQIGGETEEDLFEKFGLQYIPPELREMRGEFEAAAKDQIPKLVELKDIKGDLHMHTKATDGANTIAEMAEAAKKLGYEYILITDHTKSTRVAHGLTGKEMLGHLGKIKSIKGIKVLAGVEVDILKDGSLDYPDEILKQFDLVVASIHSNFKMPKEQMTARVIRAFQNKYVNIFSHPTGRLINEREPYQIDLEEILKAAKKYNVAIEVNAHPKRLDLTDIWCKRAKELGVKVVVSTDAHSTDQLQLMKYGILTARRGWLEKKNVLNCLSHDKLLKSLHAK